MPINSLIALASSSPGWDLIKALFSYYGLKSYVSYKITKEFNSEKIEKISAYKNNFNESGEKIFWDKIISGELKQGAIVSLNDFQISTWFPRKPGLYWSKKAFNVRKKAFDYVDSIDNKGIVLFDTYGKNILTELGGLGCVNFRKDKKQSSFNCYFFWFYRARYSYNVFKANLGNY